MPGLAVVTGRTHAEAQERFEELQSLLHPSVALSMLSSKMGYADLARLSTRSAAAALGSARTTREAGLIGGSRSPNASD